MHRLKIVVTRSAALLALATIFYASSPVSAPTTTGIAFKQASQKSSAADAIKAPNNISKHSFFLPGAFAGTIVPVKDFLNESVLDMSNASLIPSASTFGGESASQGFGIRRISLVSYRPVLPQASAYQPESTHPSLILPNIRGSEGVGILFLLCTAISMLYLARQR